MNKFSEKPKVWGRAEIVISAPVEIAWKVLTEINSWPQWNKDVSRAHIDGPLRPSTTFRWKSGGFPITSVLRTVEPMRCIVWTGSTIGVTARHEWTFESMRTGVRVRTEESFTGLLPTILPGMMRKKLEDALARSVRALKAEAERMQAR